MADESDSSELLNDLIARALKAGADAADAVDIKSIALSHAQRLGEVEKVERAESRDLGLRVFLVKNKLSRLRRILVKMHWPSWSNARFPWRKRCRMTRTAVLPTRNRY